MPPRRSLEWIRYQLPVALYRTLPLRGLYRQAVRLAPAGVRGRVDEWKVRREWMLRSRRTPLVPPGELAECYRAGLEWLVERQGAGAVGDYLEFGVFDGTSLLTMYRVLGELGLPDVRLFGFDSFEGLPASAAGDDEGFWKPGCFSCGEEIVRLRMRQAHVDPARVTLVKGYYDTTLTPELRERIGAQGRRASVVMVDCDMYLSTKTALEWCAPLLADHVLLVFDDWWPLAERRLGERRAFEEFLAVQPEWEVMESQPYNRTSRVLRLSRRAG